jgi:hypothetical protein
MNYLSRSNYLLVSIVLFILSLSILLMFMLALGLPYTERPLHTFPIPTVTATPADFSYSLPLSHPALAPDDVHR